MKNNIFIVPELDEKTIESLIYVTRRQKDSLSKAYILMTVLKGNLAIKQSKIFIRMFKNMKDSLVENNNFTNSKRLHKFI